MLVAPGEGAIMAAPEGATLPMVDGSEWGTRRTGEKFLKIFLDSNAHLGNHENTPDDLRSSKTVAQLP
jgi:hypothetical protein